MVYVDVKEKRSKEGQSRYGVERSPNHGSQETGGWGEERRGNKDLEKGEIRLQLPQGL